jgi:hypothetical protein
MQERGKEHERSSNNSFTRFFKISTKNLKKRDGRRKEETQQCEEDPKMVQITDSIGSYS